jgi:carbon-monoxide dehydrogenase small subunit
MTEIALTVNGTKRSVDVPVDRLLCNVLREDLELTGTKIGCEVGTCGACTVLVDGRLASSCLMLAGQAEGADVVTVEGLDALPRTEDIRTGFIEEGGFQCGFCTPGQLVAATALVNSPDFGDADEAHWRHEMAGNLCRCTGYYGILRALHRVAASPGPDR